MRSERPPEDLLLLALETATPVCSIALMSRQGTRISTTMDVGLRHSELLFPEIARLLRVARINMDEVSHVAVSIGPGSFTGLRIGLSAAKGICLPTGKPLVPISTLWALASRVPFAAVQVCAVLDARRSEVYAALFDTSAGLPQSLDTPRAIRPQELARDLAGQSTIFVGPGVQAFGDVIVQEHPAAQLVSPTGNGADAVGVGQLAVAVLDKDAQAGLQGRDLESLEPDYLRHPDVRMPASR